MAAKRGVGRGDRYTAGMGRAESAEPATGRGRLRVTIAGVVVVAVLLVVLIVTRSGTPSLVDAYVLEHDGRLLVSTIERRTFRGGRGASTFRYEMAVYDVETGEAVAHVELTERERDVALRRFRRVDDRLWLHSQEGIRLFDLTTAEPLLVESELLERSPALQSGYRVVEDTVNDYSPPTTGLPLVLADGRKAWLDMSGALVDAPVPTDPWRPGYFCGPDGGAKPSCERKECIAFVPVEGSAGMVLTEAPVWGRGGMVEVRAGSTAVAADQRTPFLKPGLVRLHETECAIELGGDVLVLHDESAVAPTRPHLSRTRRDGHRVWSVALPDLVPEVLGATRLEPFEARITEPGLVLLLSEPRSKQSLAVAVLDPQTGAVRTTHSLIEPD